MPIKIVASRKAGTKNFYLRGSYLGIRVDKSCRTDRLPVARAQQKKLEEQIERGDYPPRSAPREGVTFIRAANQYLEFKERRRPRYVARLIAYFGETPLADIDQEAINEAAIALYPNVVPATRNTCVYTPMSAILKHSKIKMEIERPPGAKGRIVTDWIKPSDAADIIAAADKEVSETFGTFLTFLLYTGLRLGEALQMTWGDVRLDEGLAWIRRSKDGIASDIRLRTDLIDRMRQLPASATHQRVFPYRQGGHLKHLLVRAKLFALGLECPVRRPTKWRQPPNRLLWLNFHSFRHTWATYMRQAGTDVLGLVGTGNWRSERSAARYAHVVPREEWARVEMLPALGKTRGKAG